MKCAFRLPVWIEACIYIHTVKSHFKALGLYNFKRGFGWAYKRGGGGGGLYPGGLISGIEKNVWERLDKTYPRNELKLTFHYILSWSVTYINHLLCVTKNLFVCKFQFKTLMFKKKRKRIILLQ